MSCANKTYSSTIVGSQTSARLAQYSSSVATPRSCGKNTGTALERNKLLEQVGSEPTAGESRSKKYQHKVKPGSSEIVRIQTPNMSGVTKGR